MPISYRPPAISSPTAVNAFAGGKRAERHAVNTFNLGAAAGGHPGQPSASLPPTFHPPRADFGEKGRKMSESTQYLGDAVYARFDGYQIVLTTSSHLEAEATNRIYLEPAVLDALFKFSEIVMQQEQSA